MVLVIGHRIPVDAVKSWRLTIAIYPLIEEPDRPVREPTEEEITAAKGLCPLETLGEVIVLAEVVATN